MANYKKLIGKLLKEGFGTVDDVIKGEVSSIVGDFVEAYPQFKKAKGYNYKKLYYELLNVDDGRLIAKEQRQLKRKVDRDIKNNLRDSLYEQAGLEYGGTKVEKTILDRTNKRLFNDATTDGVTDYALIRKRLNNPEYLEQISTNSKGLSFADRVDEGLKGSIDRRQAAIERYAKENNQNFVLVDDTRPYEPNFTMVDEQPKELPGDYRDPGFSNAEPSRPSTQKNNEGFTYRDSPYGYDFEGNTLPETMERARRGQGFEAHLYDEAMAGIDDPTTLFGKDRMYSQFAYKLKQEEFVEKLAGMSMDDAFTALRMDASDDLLESVYKKVMDENWQKDFLAKKYDSGAFKEYGFSGEKFADLSVDQQSRLMTDFAENNLSNFQNVYEDTFSVIDSSGNKVKTKINKKKVVNTEAQGLSPQHARQEFIKHKLGYDPSDMGENGFNSVIDDKISKLGSQTKQSQELDAYRSYVNKTYNAGKTSYIPTAEDFLSQRGLTKKEISKMKVKDLGTAEGVIRAGDKSGIGLWGTIKKHPVAALAIGMTTAWGISEMNEID